MDTHTHTPTHEIWHRVNAVDLEIHVHTKYCHTAAFVIAMDTQTDPEYTRDPLHPNDTVTRIPWITVDHRSIVDHKLGIVGLDSP